MTSEAHPLLQPRTKKRTLAATREARDLDRIYVWDLVVRLTHWTIALSMVVLTLTGLYIGTPFLISGRFVMGLVKTIHFYGAIAFTLAVLVRLIWLFVSPSKEARISSFLPLGKERLRALWKAIRFYLFLERKPPEARGHGPLAALAYALVFLLYLTMIVTGLALYSVSADVRSPMRIFEAFLPWVGGAQTARFVHHVVTWLLILFVLQHVYSAVLTAIVERNGTVDSIISGFKFVKRSKSA
jgi:Ni/Fe-hydrogenase 1 B-type cytochrome subunit